MIDGIWKCDRHTPSQKNCYGSSNNIVEVSSWYLRYHQKKVISKRYKDSPSKSPAAIRYKT